MEKSAFIITVIWFSFFGGVIVAKWDNIWGVIPLNELGDFIAGITAPMAFLWLIVGYWLQRKELSHNTKALEDQKNELEEQNKNIRDSITATKELASAIKEVGSDISQTMIHTQR